MTGDERAAVGAAAGLAVLDVPQRLAGQIEGPEHELAVAVAGDVDLAAGHGHAGEALADSVGLPEQLRARRPATP